MKEMLQRLWAGYAGPHERKYAIFTVLFGVTMAFQARTAFQNQLLNVLDAALAMAAFAWFAGYHYVKAEESHPTLQRLAGRDGPEFGGPKPPPSGTLNASNAR